MLEPVVLAMDQQTSASDFEDEVSASSQGLTLCEAEPTGRLRSPTNILVLPANSPAQECRVVVCDQGRPEALTIQVDNGKGLCSVKQDKAFSKSLLSASMTEVV